MRIIAGSARGRALKAPSGRRIRPTSDRLRESLFNIIGRRIESSRLLDLFAGSGAVGIEALSRGAAKATFVDKDAAACRLTRENLKHCRLSDRARVLRLDFRKALEAFERWGEKFDLAYIDPPYQSDYAVEALRYLRFYPCLAPGALVFVETGKTGPLPEEIRGYRQISRRRYGDSELVSLELVKTADMLAQETISREAERHGEREMGEEKLTEETAELRGGDDQ